MTVRFYSSLDAGAPALSGDLYDRVRQVLLACLVNGYGSKPAAGWTVGHDVSGGFSLGNGDGYINWVRNAVAQYLGVYIMESITDGSTALATGINRRSGGWGDDVTTTERGYFYQSNGFNGGTNPHWSLVADSKTVIFLAGAGGNGADAGSTPLGFAHYFGAYISAVGFEGAATFCSLGNGSNSASTHALGRGSQRYGSCLRNPETGLVSQGVLARYGVSPAVHWRDNPAVITVPVLLPSRLQPVRAALLYHGGEYTAQTSGEAGIAGYLRGLISEPTLAGTKLSAVCGLFGQPNTWQSRVTPIDLPNGKQWVPIYPTSAELGFFVSLDPADWE
ncbi:hypothetical protein [Azotobacter salinestris]|uniref:hypothetical protein n=1 Tax=Azotobacter salinestris TaxID=69964 RepID=UPI0032DED88F